MSTMVNVHDAKTTHLSRLVDRAGAGEEIVVARAGRTIAHPVALLPEAQRRVPGRLRGRIAIADDFDSTPEWLVDRETDGVDLLVDSHCVRG